MFWDVLSSAVRNLSHWNKYLGLSGNSWVILFRQGVMEGAKGTLCLLLYAIAVVQCAQPWWWSRSPMGVGQLSLVWWSCTYVEFSSSKRKEKQYAWVTRVYLRLWCSNNKGGKSVCSKYCLVKRLQTARAVSSGLLACRRGVFSVIFAECFEAWMGLQLI